MIDKKILISIVIVLLIGVAAASYQISTKTPGIWQPSISQAGTTAADQGSTGTTSSGQAQSSSQPQTSTSTSSSSSSSSSGSDTGAITLKTPAEAKTIASNHILDSSVLAGTPEQKTLEGKQVYYVPVVDKNTQDQKGYFIIDAKTGEIIEGAGGAPSG